MAFNLLPAEGSRTQFTSIAAAIVNVVMIGLQIFGIVLPEGLWEGVNAILASLIAYFLAAKGARTEEAANQSVAATAKVEPTPVAPPTAPGV